MKFCVIKDTTTVIDGSKNSEEIMIQNALNAGLTETEVEILTEEEYETRKSLEPKILEQISKFKVELTETDYKIIKCSEYQLAGLELPYDVAILHTERQALRDKINILELTL